MLMADSNSTDIRKSILPEEKYNATNFLTLWDFEGFFKYSPLFYGWYTNRDSTIKSYRLPFAYFITGLVAYAYSFFAILRKMAENSRMSKLSEKDDECIFSWKLFTAWDYMIGNAETAHNRVASIVVGFKEALLEEAEKKRPSRNWKIIAFRIMVNTIVLALLSSSAVAVVWVVKRSAEEDAMSTVWRRNEITVVLSLISLFFPMLFEILGLLEQYHPRKQLRIQLARIMVLNLLNLYSLIFALFGKISDMTLELEGFRNTTPVVLSTSADSKISALIPFNTSLQTYPSVITKCYEICPDVGNDSNFTMAEMIGALAINISVTAYPLIHKMIRNNVILNTTTEYNYEPDTINITNYDVTSEMSTNISNFNQTELPDGLELLQEVIFDYLQQVLAQIPVNETENYSNKTINNITNDYDYFKSTLAPVFEVTEDDIDERFDQEFSTLYDEVSTTISSFSEVPTEENKRICQKICENETFIFSEVTVPTLVKETDTALNYTTRSRLRSLCWETMFGQELIKLTVMDLIMTLLSTLAMDFARGIFVRVMNRCWCWDLEKKFPQYGDFKVAENILHLVNNQGMVWMGMFFSPGLVVINVVKLYAMMYLRAWAVLTCNVPHEIIFRASRSNNFYYALLLMMLFLCVLPVGYAIVWIRPSWHCGPFSKYQKIFHIFTKTLKDNVPQPFERVLDYVASPGIVIPLLVLLILIIYYLVSLTGALREANNDLKIQLRRERTEERRKMFQIADKRRRRGSGGSGEYSNVPFAKWKKLLKEMPEAKSFDETPRQESGEIPSPVPIKEEKTENRRTRDFFSKLMKKALGKSSTSDEDNPNNDDGTDTEQHESLPEDVVTEIRPQVHHAGRSSSGSFDFQKSAFSFLQKSKTKSPQVLQQTSTDTERRASTETRQDSASSWSDIPVIKISKTESAECLEENSKSDVPDNTEQNVDSKFKPKVRYALKKQNSEVDEEMICYFPENVPKKVGLDDIEDFGNVNKSESSGDITRTSSADTVLKLEHPEEDTNKVGLDFKTNDNNTVKNSTEEDEKKSPNGSSTQTELSSDYNEDTL